VVTRVQFRLHELRQFVGGLLLPATPDVIAAFVAEAQAAAEELSTIANVVPAPPLPFVPVEQHGRLVIMATLVYAGDVEAGQRAVAPFRTLATPIADLVRPMPYPQIYPPEQEGFHRTAVSRTMFVDAVGRAAAEAIVEHLEASPPGGGAAAGVGGAMARVRRGHRIRPPRQLAHGECRGVYQRPEEAEVHEAWVDRLAAALRAGDTRACVNFLGDEGQARIPEAYRRRPGSCWRRSRLATTRPTCSAATRTSRRPRLTPGPARSPVAASLFIGAGQHHRASATAMGAGISWIGWRGRGRPRASP
jgi:hypothetical protein